MRRLARLASDEYSSLLPTFVKYVREKFYNILPRSPYKKMYLFVTHEEAKKARAFVPGHPLRPGLILAVKAES
jgi:hypothetical protein